MGTHRKKIERSPRLLGRQHSQGNISPRRLLQPVCFPLGLGFAACTGGSSRKSLKSNCTTFARRRWAKNQSFLMQNQYSIPCLHSRQEVGSQLGSSKRNQ